MKRLICLFSLALIVLTSCSKDDDNSSNPASSILVKKITDFENDKPVFRDILYNGNKLVKIADADGSVTKFTYIGDVITKIENFDGKGELDGSIEYSYANGKLANEVEKVTGDTYYYKTKYTHKSDGTIDYEKFRGVIATTAEEKYGDSGKYTYKDGNLVKREVFYSSSVKSYVYEYDAKNSPFKNITGFSLLLDNEDSVNNLIKSTQTSSYGTNVDTYVTTYTYKYDTNNYPTERVAAFPNGNSTSNETTQYAY